MTIQQLIEGLSQLPAEVRAREALVQTAESGEVCLTVEITDVDIRDKAVVIIGDLDRVG